MKCDAAVSQLPLLLYSELSFEEEEALSQHLASCTSCRTELEHVRALHRQIGALEPEVPAQLLQDSRRNLRVAVAALHDAGLHRQSWWERLQADWSRLLKPVGAVALLAVGFAAGRVVPDGASPVRFSGLGAEPVASRIRFVQPEKAGRVQIVVEEVRQRTLEGELDDDNIRGMLLTAAREANDPGVRVETMDLLKGQWASSEVRKALLAALQHDGNPGVRLKALESLRGIPADGETRRVLTEVLLKDDNPGIRTQAIDLLTQKHEPDMVGLLQELVSREDNNYVRLKCQKALREMNASVETF